MKLLPASESRKTKRLDSCYIMVRDFFDVSDYDIMRYNTEDVQILPFVRYRLATKL